MIINFKIFEKVDRSLIDPYSEELWEDDIDDEIVICIDPTGVLEKNKEYIFIEEYEVRNRKYMVIMNKFTRTKIDGYLSNRFIFKKAV